VFFFTHDINSIIENIVYLSGLNMSPQLTLIKMLISNLVRTTRFWNNLHRVLSKPKDLKAN